jgi:hypothetical protein
MIPIVDALPAAIGDKPSPTRRVQGASEEKAQYVLQFLHHFAPGLEVVPANDHVDVRRIGADGVKAPAAALTDVRGAED